jgi:hypothetical protein
MKVGELKKILSKYPDDIEVVVCAESEQDAAREIRADLISLTTVEETGEEDTETFPRKVYMTGMFCESIEEANQEAKEQNEIVALEI